jgi:centromeric protein E
LFVFFCPFVQHSNLLYDYLKNQDLREKEHQLSQVKADLRETVDQMEQLKKKLEAQSSTLESREIEKLELTQQLNENLKKITLVTKENDSLKIMDEALREERDQLRKSLQQTEARVSPCSSLAGL